MTDPLKYIVVFLFLLNFFHSGAQNLENLGKTKPFTFGGSLSSRFVFYNVSGIPNRRDPFGYVLSGNVNIGIYELYLPFSFSYSNQGSSFGQPFNQFGVSPTYKWATVHLGYRNISYSSFTLAGHQMLGAGFDLNPGKFRIGFMVGRLRRAVQYIPPPDSLSLDSLLQTQPIPVADDPVYQRSGWSAKIGYGDNNSFIDLILFKGRDDPSSISSDSIKQSIRPAENAVIGVNARKMFFNKLSVFFEGAISAYTRDRDLQEEGEADSVSISKLFKPFIPINSTTYYYRALKTGFNYTHTKFNVQADYQRIDPDYQSMGAYFFTSDIEALNISPSFYLLQNKVIVTSGLLYQHDNLNNKKQFTTHRTIPRINLSINPDPRYGIDLGYMDMMTNQTSGVTEVTDSTRMRMNNPGITMSGRYNILDSLHTHTFMLMLNRFELKDKNPLTKPYSQYTASIVNLNYNFFLVKKNLGLNLSFISNLLESFNGKAKSFGLSAGGSKGIKENKFTINASWNSNFGDQGNSHNVTVGGGFMPGTRFTMSANISYLTADQDATQFTEFTGFVECRYNLGKMKKP